MNAQPKSQTPILPPVPLTVHQYITAGSLPEWEQMPPNCQQELIHTLASLLLRLPELQALPEAPHEPQP